MPSIEKNIIYITGLPRSGSTLLCQLLDIPSEIYSSGHSSPLCQTLLNLRHNLSDNEFLLSQLDVDFDRGYQRLLNSYRGFVNGWFSDVDKNWVVDKNRGWLMQLELVNLLDPNFKMLVCIREPSQIYGSIEAQHQKTLLLDFPDKLANLSRHQRADKLFADTGVIGSPMQAIEALQDVPELLQERLFYVIFEHLMQEPQALMREIYQWLDIPNTPFNPQELPIKQHESDSYYRFKYLHKTRGNLSQPQHHVVPQRIETDIKKQFSDFYRLFYPGMQGENGQ